MSKPTSRRNFMKIAGAMAASAPFLSRCQAQPSTPNPPSNPLAKGALRIVNISDIHYHDTPSVRDRFTKALKHIHSLDPLPEAIINTGDSIMDSLGESKSSAQKQWDAFNTLMAAECTLPVYHCLGNHDVWGWDYQKFDPTIVDDPLFGKPMGIKNLNLPGRYYSFDLKGWHFIMLDSMQPPEVEEPFTCYIGKLDDEQFEWLTEELTLHASKPVCIASHIPLLCACEYYDGDNETPDYWKVPAAWMHIDSRRTRNLFLKHENVKLCLSGHTHQVEDLRYLNVNYLNNGAICGAWWKGSYLDFPPGYVVIDLYDDGSVTSQFLTYQ